MEKEKDIPIGKATIIAAIIAAIFGLIGTLILTKEGNKIPKQDIKQETTVNVNEGAAQNDLCFKIKNEADRLSLIFEKKKNSVSEMDEKRLDYLFFRDRLREYNKYECQKISGNYNEINDFFARANEFLKK